MPSNLAANPQNPYRSSVVRASAGSGKTYQLSRRFLFLVGAGAQPSSILTVTFTKKAAAEMRARILDLAAQLIADPEAQGQFETQLKAFYKDSGPKDGRPPRSALETASSILASTQSLRISTIDSILLEWLRKFPYEASGQGALQIPPRFDLLSPYAEERLLRKAWHRTLNGLKEDGEDRLRVLLQNPDDLHLLDLENRVHQLGRHESFLWLLAHERPHLLSQLVAHPLDEDWGEAHESDLVAAIAAPFRTLGQSLKPDRQQDLALALGAGTIAALREGRFLTAELQINGNTFRGPKREAHALEVEQISRFCLSFFAYRLKRRLNTTGEALMQLFARYQKELGRLKFEEASLGFPDLIKGGYYLFTDDEAAGARYLLNRSIRHLLLDEFQDTSVLQWTVFRAMAEELLSGQGYRSADELNPTLFVVGDAKQSIYGFREAEAEILDAAADFMLERAADNVELSASYRTHRFLLDLVNRVMQAVMPAFPIHVPAPKDEHQPLIQGRASVLIAPLFQPAETGEKPVEAEARFVAETLAARIRNGEKVYDRQLGGYRPLRPRDCALLYRASTHARVFAQALRDKGISVRIEEGQSFFKRPEIMDLSALCRLFAFPNDAQAAFQALKSPLLRVPEDQILPVLRDLRLSFDDSEAGRKQDLLTPLLEALGDPAEPLQDALKNRHADRPYLILKSLSERLDWLQSYRTAFGPEDGVLAAANVQKFLELVLQTDRAGQLSWMQVLRSLKEREREEAVSLASVSEDAVQLMTIHKAKGLEWPLVVVSGTGEEWEKSDLYWAKLKDKAAGTGLAYIGKRSEIPEGDPHFSQLMKELNDEALRENYRLLYVALTRAQFELIITASQKKAKDGEAYFYSLIRGAAQDLGYAPLAEHPDALYARAEDVLPDADRTSEGPAPDPLAGLSGWRSLRGGSKRGTKILAPARLLSDREEKSSGSPTLPFPVEAGSFIHLALEHAILEKTFEAETSWERLRRHHPQTAFAAAYAQVKCEADRVLASDAWHALKSSAKQVFAEMPIAYLQGDMLVRGILDLLIQREDGSWLVVDYKSSWDAIGNTDLVSLCYQKNYDKQLALYLEGIRRLQPGEAVEGAIFFTAQQTLVSLTPQN